MFNDYFRLFHSYSTHQTMVQAPPAPTEPPSTGKQGVSKCSMIFFWFCHGYSTQMFKSKLSSFTGWFSKTPKVANSSPEAVSKCSMIIFDFVADIQHSIIIRCRHHPDKETWVNVQWSLLTLSLMSKHKSTRYPTKEVQHHIMDRHRITRLHHPRNQTWVTVQCSFLTLSLISNTEAEKTPLSLNLLKLTILSMSLSKSLFFQIRCGRIFYRKLL